MDKRIPEGKARRTGVAGLAAAKVGLGELGHKIKRPFLSEQNAKLQKDILDDKNAKILFTALTQLRGTALKVAQMIGMDQGILPEAYRKELSKSFHQVPPLNRVLVRKIMLEELNNPPEKVFATFESKAFAAASLGQVHKAELADGTTVAVKVQYPGIAASIASDMTMIRGISRSLPNTQLILQSIAEVEARLKEETNYKTEADNTLWFSQNVNIEGISIPTTYPEFSTERILTTEFVEGLHLNEWLETNPSQEVRNRAAQTLYDFFMHSSEQLNCLHADPNPGNYLFHADGSITIIDFGCVRQISEQFNTLFSQLISGYIKDDFIQVFKVYKAFGMRHAEPTEAFYNDILRPVGQWVTEPLRQPSFDFKEHSDYTISGQVSMKSIHEMMKIDHIAEEFIFHNRTLFGLYQIFEKMGATVKMQHKSISDNT